MSASSAELMPNGNSIAFSDFSKAVQYFQKVEPNDRIYLPHLKRVQGAWRSPSLLLMGDILDFLNKWQMRLNRNPKLLDCMLEAVKETTPYLMAFQSVNLEECEMDAPIRVGSECPRIDQAALYMFERFCALGYKFADVAAAKTLHLFAPSFFVIWDNTTRFSLAAGRGTAAWVYVRSYLPRVQHDLRCLVKDTSTMFGIDEQSAVEKLVSIVPNRKSLTKLIDEYYWARYTRGIFKTKLEDA